MRLAYGQISKNWRLVRKFERYLVQINWAALHNDAEMIDYAGLGVVMKNGTDKLKRIADDVTEFDNDHDGVANYLQKALGL